MKKIIIASIAAFLLSSSPALAAKVGKFTKDLEYGAGIGMVDMGLTDSGVLFYGIVEKPLAIKSLEKEGFNSVAQLRLGTSTAASGPFLGGTIESSIDYMISGLFKSSIEIEKAVTAYAMLGFSYASITTTTPTIVFFGIPVGGGSVSSTDSSLSWGVGADYEVDRDLTVGIEYAAYWSDITALAVNAKFAF